MSGEARYTDDYGVGRKYQHEDFVTYSEGPYIANFTSTANPVDASAYIFRVTSVTGEQLALLRDNLNRYQQYRLKGAEVVFRPYVTESTSVTVVDATDGTPIGDYIYNSGTSTITETASRNVRGAVSIVIVPEHDDNIVRNNLDEFYRTRNLPHAKNCLSTERCEINIMPTVQTSAQDTLDDETDPDNTSMPRMRPWLATKINTAGGTVSFNELVVHHGFKLYAYNPYLNVNTVTRTLGTIGIKLRWEFRYLDNRALINPFTLLGLDAQELGGGQSFSLNSFMRTSPFALVGTEENSISDKKPPDESIGNMELVLNPPVLKRARQV